MPLRLCVSLRYLLLALALVPGVSSGALADTEILQRIETELLPLIREPPEQLTSQLRLFSARYVDIDSLAVWQTGARVFPPAHEILTLSESRQLAIHGNTFAQLLATEEFRQNGLVQTILPGPNSKSIRCWHNASALVPLDLCVVGQLTHPDTWSPAPLQRKEKTLVKHLHEWSFPLIAALCVLGCLFGVHRKMREWVHDFRQPLANLRLNLALLPRYPDQHDRLHADMVLEIHKLDRILSALSLCLPTCLTWNKQQEKQQPLHLVLGEVIDSYHNRLHWVGCELAIDLGPTIQQPVAAVSLQRIAGNLIYNCIRHAPGCVLTISVRTVESPAPYTRVDFECTAIPSHLAIKRNGDSGLGLRSVKRLARKQGWQCTVTKTESKFHVSLSIPSTARIQTDGYWLC